MAWRAALLTVLLFLPTCSAISFTRTASSAAAAEPQSAASECQEVKVGTPCYESVDWLRQYGLSKHPEWYPGYTSESTFEEVQDMLHGLGKVNCPKPCFVKKPLADNCHDVAEGGCYESILWLKRYGLEQHPDWYPNLQLSSSVSEIQAELHRSGKVSCPKPCAFTEMGNTNIATRTGLEKTADQATEQCVDAKLDTPCYSAVIYGINEGISNYPFMYEGLKDGSSFKTVQEYLYLQARPQQEPCGKPCPFEQVDLETLAKHPENLRVKKRVEDMSMSELEDFFSGKWDGYVSKIVHGDWQPTTTFEKRLYDPTTTVPEDRLPDYQLPLPLLDDYITPAEAATTAEKTEAANGTEKTEAAVDTGLEAASKAAAETAPAPVDAASSTEETKEASVANDTVPEETSNVAAEVGSVSTEEVVQDSDIVDKPMPEVDGNGRDAEMQAREMLEEMEPETREEMEQRIRKQLMDEMQLQTTTVAVQRETEEEMRQRLKAELMREMMSKAQ